MEKEEFELDPEGKKNLVGLFDLLYKVDKRINPELYEEPTEESER